MSQTYTYYSNDGSNHVCRTLTITTKSVVFKHEGRRLTRGGQNDVANKVHEMTLPNGKTGRFIYTGPEHNPLIRKYYTKEDLTNGILSCKHRPMASSFYETKLVAGTEDTWFSVVRPTLYRVGGSRYDKGRVEAFSNQVQLLRTKDKYADRIRVYEAWRNDPNRDYKNMPDTSDGVYSLATELKDAEVFYTDKGMRIRTSTGHDYSNEHEVFYVADQYVKWGGWKVIYMGTSIAVNHKKTPSELKTATEPEFVEYVERKRALKEELVAKVFHPDRVERLNETYGVECWMDCVE